MCVEESLPGLRGVPRVGIEGARRQVGKRDLEGGVHDVARDHGALAPGLDRNGNVAGCMAGCRYQAQIRSENMVGLDEVYEIRVDEGRDRRLVDRCVVVGLDSFELDAREQISRVRKRGHTARPDDPRVPADVIKVEMCAQHGVDGFEPAVDGGFESLEEGRIPPKRARRLHPGTRVDQEP